ERWGEDNLLTCTILKTDASDGIKDLHTRMPVMLAKDGFEPWLSGSDLVPDAGIDAAVKITSVSPKMNKPSYACILMPASQLCTPRWLEDVPLRCYQKLQLKLRYGKLTIPGGRGSFHHFLSGFSNKTGHSYSGEENLGSPG